MVDERQQLLAGRPHRGENLHCGPEPRPGALRARVNGEKASCTAPSRFERHPRHSESMRAAIHISCMLPDNDFHFRLSVSSAPSLAAISWRRCASYIDQGRMRQQSGLQRQVPLKMELTPVRRVVKERFIDVCKRLFRRGIFAGPRALHAKVTIGVYGHWHSRRGTNHEAAVSELRRGRCASARVLPGELSVAFENREYARQPRLFQKAMTQGNDHGDSRRDE
jgi:hypothetical protein